MSEGFVMTRLALTLFLLTTPAMAQQDCMVMDVIDGDTLRCMSGEGMVTVRVRCLDTPERGEKGFEEASDDARELLASGSFVMLQPPFREDRYGRRVADVDLGGRTFSDEMKALGWAGYPDRLCGER